MRASTKYAYRLRSLLAFIRANLTDLAIAEADYDRALDEINNPGARTLLAHIKANLTELAADATPRGQHPKAIIDFWAKPPTQSGRQTPIDLPATAALR